MCRILIILLICIVFEIGCSQKNSISNIEFNECEAHYPFICNINNDHIKWSGTPYGIVLISMGDTETELLKFGANAIPCLLEAMKDETKWVTAHVLLTMIAKEDNKINTHSWNGLALLINNTGKIQYDLNDQKKLERKWCDYWRDRELKTRSKRIGKN